MKVGIDAIGNYIDHYNPLIPVGKYSQSITISFVGLPGKNNKKKRAGKTGDHRLMYCVYHLLKTIPDANLFYFTKALIWLEQQLNEQNIHLKLPTYWYIWGQEIEWETLKKRLNKIGYDIEVEIWNQQ